MSETYQKGQMIYEGKAKRLFDVVGHPELLWQDFKDSLTAFNAAKKGEFAEKGSVNCQIATKIYDFLSQQGIRTHFVAQPSANVMITQKLEMAKVEVVVRNVLAGSTAKKFGLAEGTPLEKPLVEFYYKDDALNDPFISDEQAEMMKVGSPSELKAFKEMGLRVNESLVGYFKKAGLQLVDFKIEVGWTPYRELLLADEITPDTCRLWDVTTSEKFDKDRFRRDLGNVEGAYREVLKRIEGSTISRPGESR